MAASSRAVGQILRCAFEGRQPFGDQYRFKFFTRQAGELQHFKYPKGLRERDMRYSVVENSAPR